MKEPLFQEAEDFLEVNKNKKETEFMTISQGNQTVVEYRAKCSELLLYNLHLISDPTRKVRMLERGLKLVIGH